MTTIPEVSNPIPPTQAEMLHHIRSLRQMVAGFVFERPEERRRLHGNATVSDRFLSDVAIGIEASPPLAANLDFTGDDLREAITFTQTYRPIVEELRLLARSLSYMITEKRSKAGQRAYHAYTLSKTLNRPGDREVLVPHIVAMKAALGGRGKRKAVPPAEAPVVETTAQK